MTKLFYSQNLEKNIFKSKEGFKIHFFFRILSTAAHSSEEKWEITNKKLRRIWGRQEGAYCSKSAWIMENGKDVAPCSSSQRTKNLSFVQNGYHQIKTNYFIYLQQYIDRGKIDFLSRESNLGQLILQYIWLF